MYEFMARGLGLKRLFDSKEQSVVCTVRCVEKVEQLLPPVRFRLACAPESAEYGNVHGRHEPILKAQCSGHPY